MVVGTRAGFLAALAVTAAAAGLLAGAAAPASARWQPVPGLAADLGYGDVDLAWVSNRAWLALTDQRGGILVTSVRIAGGAPGAFKTTRVVGGPADRLVVGAELVYVTTSGVTPVLQSRQLRADGTVGPASAAPLDPAAVAPQHHLQLGAAIRVGDRTVWALPGTTRAFNPRGVLWVCCAEDGSATELTRLIDRASAPRPVRLGLDGRGRLWLTWRDRSGVQIVELDRSSLAPRTARATEAPSRGPQRFELVCTAACRVVIEDYAGIHSWAPGERSVSRIARPPNQYVQPMLLAASLRSGRLLVAYTGWDDRTATPRIVVARGDARGAQARVVGSSSHSNVGPYTHAIFVPSGLLAITPRSPNGRSAILLDLIRTSR